MKQTKSKLAIFEGKKIRSAWDEEREKWWFSVVDVVGVLSESIDPRKYWNKLAQRLREEGSESVTKCHRLKMEAEDEKLRETDVADVETIFRLVQSVPSPKAESIKLWLTRVGYERVKEIEDPELISTESFRFIPLSFSRKWESTFMYV